MAIFTAKGLKDYLGGMFSGVWVHNRSYQGFNDNFYSTVPLGTWNAMAGTIAANSIPTVPYHYEVFDCDDFAMKFKSMTAEFHVRNIPLLHDIPHPFAIGIANGFFNTRADQHSMNFVLAEDENGGLKPFFFDLEVALSTSVDHACYRIDILERDLFWMFI